MPRSLGYSRGKHIAMQAAMWLIFAGTLGVAGLASQARRAGGTIALADPIDLETVSVRLPAKWKIFDRGANELYATESSGMTTARFIAVEEHETGLIERVFTSPPKKSRRDQAIKIGPISGTLNISTKKMPLDENDDDLTVDQAIIRATGDLDTTRTITITLRAVMEDQTIDPADIELVKQVAASIRRIDPDDKIPHMRSR